MTGCIKASPPWSRSPPASPLDRWRRYKEVAGLGYALSAISRAGLLATTAWTGIAGLLVVDRIGKGIRTAPRDALISLSVPRDRLGVAFGIHRAMDAMGAMLGPVIAFGLLAIAPFAFDLVFAASLAIGVVGLAVLAFFVENREPEARTAAPSMGATVIEALRLLRRTRFRYLALCAFMLGLTTISDAFVYLALQRQVNIGLGVFPLLYVLTSLSYLMLAIPVGQFSDRVGRWPVFLAGYAMLLVLNATLLWAPPSSVMIVAAVVLLGAHYAATEGVLMALGSALLPDDVRSSGLAVLTTATAVSRLAGAILFGWMWTHWGLASALTTFLSALWTVIVAALVLMPRERRDE